MERWRISNSVITETHRYFKQTTWVADCRCCHYFTKMNFLTVTGKKQQLYTHRSLPPPPNRHMLWKSRTDSPPLQNPRAQSCLFCWRKIHRGKSRGKSNWADSGTVKSPQVRYPAPPKPQHSPAAERSHTAELSPAPDCHQLMDRQTVSTHNPTLS